MKNIFNVKKGEGGSDQRGKRMESRERHKLGGTLEHVTLI